MLIIKYAHASDLRYIYIYISKLVLQENNRVLIWLNPR